MIQPSRETEQTFRWCAFFVWGARRAKYPRRPRRVALWGDLGGAQFSVTEVNREGRAPARPRALSIAASKLFRIIISEAIVTEVGEISLRKTEMVGWVQAGRTVNSWKDEKRWGGFSAPRAEGGAGTSRAGPVCGEHLWERGGGRGVTTKRIEFSYSTGNSGEAIAKPAAASAVSSKPPYLFRENRCNSGRAASTMPPL